MPAPGSTESGIMIKQTEPARSLVLIGGSMGAFDVVSRILSGLSELPKTALIVVLHHPEGAGGALIETLQARTRLPVRPATDKQVILPNHVFVAMPGYHLLVERSGALALDVGEPVWFARPSIDVLFTSAALAYGPRVLALLLSGANEDGAAGLVEIHQRAGKTAIQQPETCLAPRMPQAALDRGGVDTLLRPEQMVAWIREPLDKSGADQLDG